MSRYQSPVEMTAEEFRQSAFVLPVRRVNLPRGRKSDVGDGYRPLLSRLEQVVAAGLMTESAYTGLLIEKLLSVDFKDDLYWSALPDGTVVVLAEEGVYQQVGERRLVEEVHAAELERALARGEEVPMELVQFYRKLPPAIGQNEQARH